MEPKAIRPVTHDWDKSDEADVADHAPVTATPVKKTESTYEQRLKKMTNRQLRHEIKRGIRGDLTDYRSVAEAVVLDVILKSFEQGMSPVIR